MTASRNLASGLPSAPGGESATLAHLQTLRALACTMVVFHHALNFSWPPGLVPMVWTVGAHGVEVFFVISGFIIAWSISRQRPDPARFLMRRLLRILPLYWLALLLVARHDLFVPSAHADLLRDFLFVPRFASRYPGEIYPAVVPGWSLNYEVFFYLLLAAALVLTRRPLLLASAALGALVLTGTVFGPFDTAPAEFYTRPYLLMFVLGIGVAAACRRGWRLQHRPTLWGLAAACVLALALPLEGPMGLVIGLPAGLLVWAAVCLSSPQARPGLLLLVGNASFSIYLFHGWGQSAVASLMRKALQWPLPDSTAMRLVEITLTVSGGLAAGLLVYVLIERPMMQWLNRPRGRRPERLSLPSRPAPL